MIIEPARKTVGPMLMAAAIKEHQSGRSRFTNEATAKGAASIVVRTGARITTPSTPYPLEFAAAKMAMAMPQSVNATDI